MNLEIELTDYLDEETIKELAIDAVRESFRSQIRNEADVERVLSNLSYEYVFSALVDCLDGIDVRDYLKPKVDEILCNPDSLRFLIFREGDAWGRKESPATKILNEVLSETRPIIEEQVKKRIAEYPFRELQEDIDDTIYYCIRRVMHGEE